MTSATVLVHPQPSAVSIEIRGELDLDNAGEVEAQLTRAIPNHLTTVEIDLAGLTFLDSAGLRVLFDLAAHLDVLQIGLHIHAPPGSPPRRVLELTGFDALARLEPVSPQGTLEPSG